MPSWQVIPGASLVRKLRTTPGMTCSGPYFSTARCGISTEFCVVRMVVVAGSSGRSTGPRVLVAKMTRSASSGMVWATWASMRRVPSGLRNSMGDWLSQSNVAPRAIKVTSAPARDRCTPSQVPTAPAPYTTIFIISTVSEVSLCPVVLPHCLTTWP